MTNQITGARYLAQSLKDCGVDHVFFIDAVLRHTLIELEQLGVKRMLTHSEKAAAYMADGYARVKNGLGVCMAQSVGAANLASGLQDAYLHRSAVLALTGRKQPMFQYRNAYQEIEHAPMFRPVTKFQANVDEPAQLPLLLAQAMREATEGTPRPVHLDFAGLQAEGIEMAFLSSSNRPSRALAGLNRHRPRAAPEEIEAAAARLAKAAKPVLVIGTGAMQAGAQAAVRALAEKLSIPIFTSLGGRGVVETTHPLHVGVVGTYSAPITNQLVHEADLVVYVGSHTGDQVTNNWTVPGPGVAIIQIDCDAREIGRNYPDVAGVCGDVKLAVEDLTRAASAKPEWAQWARDARARFKAWSASRDDKRRSNDSPVHVDRLCDVLSDLLPEDGILVADTGYSGIWTGTMVELRHAAQTYLRAAGSLGWAFPAAMGAKCAAPDRPVICFTGDGAFYYHLAELETARRMDIPLVVVVNNNCGFGQGLYRVRAMQGDRPGNPDALLCHGPTNFADVARAFGCEGIRVDDADGIAPAIARALEMQAPVVVDVATSMDSRGPDAWSPPK
ncbi:MAG TPA: thiamine pyrophosphate-binding protein [Hyphomicrobiaceae bacterium]|nr:thiamine pyrophosphate-binding protein [Hyphomicrobiaceae bacterium]